MLDAVEQQHPQAGRRPPGDHAHPGHDHRPVPPDLAEVEEPLGEGRVFGSVAEAIMAYDAGELDLQAPIRLRLPGVDPDGGRSCRRTGEGETLLVETTLGRALFNETLPVDYPFVERAGRQEAPLARSSTTSPSATPRCRSPRRSTRSRRPASTGAPVRHHGRHLRRRHAAAQEGDPGVATRSKAAKVQGQYERGLITDDERRQELIEIWTQATERGRQGDGEQPSRQPTRST